ncbi:hypothetical protein EKE94_11325 [Mesobaculum littorinae]|uniref:Uncharacterized protein n=1 Tax=Mesobaculum littorinae TaxID=2486419 RepID=A0A438AHP1_9RHOB|nr:hypothetical protein EKE94_11325 [Mesobaculum littorinae]
MAEAAAALDLGALRHLRQQALALRRRVDRVIYVADSRLTLPMVGSNAMRRPPGADWAYRPDLWRGPLLVRGAADVPTGTALDGEATLFHDCPLSEITVRQVRNTSESDLAPYGLRLDVFGFRGSFLSLALTLPEAAAKGLRRRHIVQLSAFVDAETPLTILARLNIKHGPNSDQMVQRLPPGDRERVAEFDLAYLQLNERRIERIWVDLIFEDPGMMGVVLRDVTLNRRPRAEM